MLGVHAGKLERYLGREAVERASLAMKDWYGPPIAVAGVPGNVWLHKGGDYRGTSKVGAFASARDIAEGITRRIARAARRTAREEAFRVSMGFASLSDMISEVTANGKTTDFVFNKAGPTGVVAVTSTLWRLGNQPIGGAAPGSAPGGTACTSSTTGAFGQLRNVSTDTQHLVSASPVASVAGNTLLLYDRLFHVLKTMASTGTETVTGVPTRYQSTTSSNPDYIGGNFGFVEVGGTALASTAHNWTTCLYTNQAGSGATLPSLTGNSGAIVDRLDHPTSSWFAPLASGDVGIGAWTQMQCSASVATGVINFVIGHPIAMMPCQVANQVCTFDGITTAFNLVRIFDNACLSFLEVCKPSTTATTYTGTFKTAWG